MPYQVRVVLLSIFSVFLLALVLPVVMDIVESLLRLDAVGNVGTVIDVVYWTLLAVFGYGVTYLWYRRIFHGWMLYMASSLPITGLIVVLYVSSF